MTLSVSSLEWAVDYVSDHSDGDLFPRIAEMAAIRECKTALANEIAGKQLSDFAPGPHRRFIVPKDEISYRQATQLYPQDSIILSAIVYEYGSGIEAKRRPTDQVFSYRFAPTQDHGLYKGQSSWNDFWTRALKIGSRSESILYCDISDFYNQIYHHTVENQLVECGFPNQVAKWIISLLASTTAGVSRGVPIGPHAAHIIAEASMIPIDNSMAHSDLKFLRYADDIVIFSKSLRESKQCLTRVANILDKQQRLHLQRHKTKFFNKIEFTKFCHSMIEDRPINDEEEGLLKLVKKYSGGDPYANISYNQISDDDWNSIDEGVITRIIEEYLGSAEVDFIRIRWFYRRLAQIGHPGALAVTLDNLGRLTPCFASICTYIASLQKITSANWKAIGSRLLAFLRVKEIKESEYFRLSILSLFSRNESINHFRALAKAYRWKRSVCKT